MGNQQRYRSRITGAGDVDPRTLTPNPQNWRTHPQRQLDALDDALAQIGWVDRIIVNETTGHVIDGHARLELAIEAGDPTVPVLYVQLSHEEEQIVLASFDPLSAIAERDEAALKSLLEDIRLAEGPLADLLDSMSPQETGGEEVGPVDAGTYTSKIKAPIYEPKGEQPEVGELFDDVKAKALTEEIDSADLPSDLAAFLRLAATRHVKFNFARIAEYYAHADAPTQRLMENSALVIIDFDRAIENGFVRLVGRLREQYARDEEIAKLAADCEDEDDGEDEADA